MNRMPHVDRTALKLAMCAVVATTFLQKLALPGSNGALSLTVLLVPLIIFAGLITRVLEINRSAYIPYTMFLLIGLWDLLAAASGAVSLPSLALSSVVQSSLIFRFSPEVSIATKLHQFFRNAIFILALLGITQFGLQFLVGPRVAFFFDYLPSGMIVSNFNVLNPLAWNSPIFKSNGVFLLEPSFLSQLVCIGIALELMVWREPLRLSVLCIAELLSFSGTGLVMLGLFLPIYAFSRRQYRILFFAFLLIVTVFLLAESLGLNALTTRVYEVGSRGSSGWARFVSPFLYLNDAVFRSPWSFLFGQGPGSIEQTKSLDYQVFDPTWAKLLYEYGLLGVTVYSCFFYSAFIRSRMPLRLPLACTYVLLGGYLLNPSMVALLAVMVVWTGTEEFSPSSAGLWRRTDTSPSVGSVEGSVMTEEDAPLP